MKTVSMLIFSFVLACSQGNSDGYMKAETVEAVYDESGMDSDFAGNEESINISETQELQEQKIVKSARLAFETQEVAETHKKILQLAAKYKGVVQNDNSGKGYNRVFRNMIVRIPTENFQQFIDGISEGVEYFDQRDISRQDVTEEFVDLEARLKAKRELENRYLQLLSQAKNVKEMLEIERELSTIREEIEAKQGRLKYLQSRVSMSTVNIDFYKITSETGITQSYGQKMINSFKGGWDGVSVVFLGLLYLWPLLIIGLITVFLIRLLVLKNRKKSIKK